MTQRVYTMHKTCPKCGTYFLIGGSAAVYCQNRACQNKRRRDDRADRKAGRGAYAPYVEPGSDAHLAIAKRSAE